MESLVSIIMSTYKTKKEYLDLAIESILNQTYNNIEFIIICDGDKEEYEYIKSKYKDNRIKLLLHNNNKGLPYSLNEAIKQANGTYIARMDSDDISLKNRIKMQVEFMKKHPHIQILGTIKKNIGDDNNFNKVFFTKPREIEVEMLYIPVLTHPTVMFRKSFFDNKNNFYNKEFLCAQDYELWARTVNSENIGILNKVCLNYRVHSQQIGSKKREQQLNYTKQIHKRNIKKIAKEYDEKCLKCFSYLYGIDKMNENNYLEIAKIIDEIIKNNTYFKKSTLKKVLYNRYMTLLIKNNLLIKSFRRKVFKKVYNYTNFRYLIWKIFTGLKCKIIR